MHYALIVQINLLFQARNNLLPLRLLLQGACGRGQVPQELLQKVPFEGRPGLRVRRQRVPLRVRDEEEDVRVRPD